MPRRLPAASPTGAKDTPALVPGSRQFAAAWLAIGGLSAVYGLLYLATQPTLLADGGWFAFDGRRVFDAVQAWQARVDPYQIQGYLYSPAGTLLAWPFAALGAAPGVSAWLGVEVGLVCLATLWATHGARRIQRLAAAASVLLFMPVIADLTLANVTIAITFAMILVVRRDDMAHGVLLGVLAAAFPKPLLAPFFLWALVWRRRALAGAIVSGAMLTAIALIVAGPSAYLSYVRLLIAGGGVGTEFTGNTGLSRISVPLALAAGVVVGVLLIVVLLRRGPVAGLLWATAAGIYLAPYAGGYAALPIMVALPALAAVSPRLSLVAGLALVGLAQAYPLSGAVVLVIALLLPRSADRSLHGDASVPPWTRTNSNPVGAGAVGHVDGRTATSES